MMTAKRTDCKVVNDSACMDSLATVNGAANTTGHRPNLNQAIILHIYSIIMVLRARPVEPSQMSLNVIRVLRVYR